MASPKVFVSSTCYDLGMVREQIRSFLLSLGYEPIMSEYSDVLYDPRQHTHTNCLQEIPNADMVVLLVGSRFGGKAIPEALKLLDVDNLLKASVDTTVLEDIEKLSVTQLEVLKAIDKSIPVFAFVDEKVWHDHLVYEKNKDLVDSIKFPSIDKPESAKFIFEFLNFLRSRTEGNSVIPFGKTEDIEIHLRKQWSSLFQRLLQEQRISRTDEKRSGAITEQIEDLRTAVLSTISNSQTRDVARGVIKYRRLNDFIRGIGLTSQDVVNDEDLKFDALLEQVGIVEISSIPSESGRRNSRTALIKEDRTFFESRYNDEFFHRVSVDWASFSALPKEHREVIFDALSDIDGLNGNMLRYRSFPYEDLLNESEDEQTTTTSSSIKELLALFDDETEKAS
ncbi:DUF4062 domain-containing protein [Vibrio breoganii]|uniref:DUF4062 domain-containing protein n=1 Tax=Vibrio breoganii TaxID=553239 RepID=UPI0021C3649D|nr:DUF4062 domain-containing protein [Vibrio breoganii]MDN3717970.1 DUF4062 domain-containing protein [Vibrio breoganii]